jgi:hypothetical protein
MPVAMVSFADSKAQYDAVPGVMTPKPQGLLVHAASELPDGRVQIIDVWEDEASSRTFAEKVLFPAFRQAGLLEQMMAAPQPVAYETFDFAQ